MREHPRRAATENLDALDDEYGVTQAKLTALQTKIDAFRSAQPEPRRTRATSSAATEQLRAAFTQAVQILKGKLDKLVVQFEADAPKFYAEYVSACRVGEATTRSAKDKQGTLPLPKAA